MRLVRVLAVTAFGRERLYTSSGLWAVVEGQAEARGTTVRVAAASWRGRSGADYAASERLSSVPGGLSTVPLQRGLPRRFVLVFEIPESKRSGARLLVSQSRLTPLDSEVEVALDVAGIAVAERIELGKGKP